MKKRDVSFDIIRALAIILMVIGHSGAPFTRMIYLFHIPAFFILSGLLYNHPIESFSQFKLRLKSRLERLYLPYVCFNVIYILFNNLFVNIGWYLSSTEGIPNDSLTYIGSLQHKMDVSEIVATIIKTFLFLGGSQMGGALWFLRAMFISIILFDIEHYVLNKSQNRKEIILLINLLLFVLGVFLAYYRIKLPANFDTVLIVMLFYSIGECSKAILMSFKNRSVLFYIVISLFIGLFLCFASFHNRVNIGANEYTSWYMMLVCALSGFVLLFSLSELLVRLRVSEIIGYIGRHTIIILGLHFLVFKLVTVIIVAIGSMPSYNLAAYPALVKYWFIYSVVGLTIPLALTYLTKNIKYIRAW